MIIGGKIGGVTVVGEGGVGLSGVLGPDWGLIGPYVGGAGTMVQMTSGEGDGETGTGEGAGGFD